MSTARPSFKFRGGSFHALVVKPETPIEAWLADVDVLLARSPGFFAGKSVVIDVSGLSLTKPTFLGLLDELSRRDIRILGVEGANPADVDGRVPSLVRGQADRSDAAAAPAPAVQSPQPAPVSSLLIDAPVRSGQAIVHPDGDVTIVGSVSSGAEIIAAGSIHVYGTLRGRSSWLVPTATNGRESFAAGWTPSSSPSTATTSLPTKSSLICARRRYKPGSKGMSSRS